MYINKNTHIHAVTVDIKRGSVFEGAQGLEGEKRMENIVIKLNL